MTLHEAIKTVLKEENKPLTSVEIADIINNKGYYKRKDNAPVRDVQIISRVNSYSYLFDFNNDREITLKSEDVLKSLMHRFSYILFVESKEAKLDYSESIIGINSLLFVSLIPLQLNKTNVLKNYFANYDLKDPKKKLNDFIEKTSAYFSNKDSLFQPLLLIIKKLNKKNCNEIINVLISFWKSNYSKFKSDQIGRFYSENLNAFSTWDSDIYHEYSTPTVLSTFLSKLFVLEKQSLIFDPFAGFCSSLIKLAQLNKAHSIVAWDISEMCVCMGSQNLIINQIENFQYELQNSFDSKRKPLQADCIVTNPPIQSWNSIPIHDFLNANSWLQSVVGNVGNLSLDSLSSSIIIALYHLNEKGKAAIIVPNTFLSGNRKDYRAFREILVRAKILNAVIALPLNIYKPYTNLGFSILLIDKSKTNDGIYFLDNSNLRVSEFEISIDKIIDALKGLKEIEDISCTVSVENINRTFDLSPRTYLFEKIKGHNLVNLDNVLVSCYSGVNIQKNNLNPQEGVPYIQISDLADSESTNIIDLLAVKSYISDSSLFEKRIRYIPSGSIIIAKVGTRLKPTLFNQNIKAVCSANILVLVPNSALITSEYLLSQFQSEYVQRQIDAIRKYIGPPNFSRADLVKIKISVPGMEEQQKQVSEFYIKQAFNEKSKIEKRNEDELYNLISSLKHELKQPISSIGLEIASIKDFLDAKIISQLPVSWHEPIVETLQGQSNSDLTDFFLSNVVNRLESNVKEAQLLLAKAEETLNLNKGGVSPETFNLKEFLLRTILPVYQNANCSIKISGHTINITADKYQISVLFKRIIENAIKHGFHNNKSKLENIINIILVGREESDNFYQIIVENNGEILPENFDINSFQSQGHTSNRYTGSGFGGYHIKRIIENHKGELHIATKEETAGSKFQVKFKIFLP